MKQYPLYKNFLSPFGYFLCPLLLFWLINVLLLVFLGYKESFLFLNTHYYPPIDHFMLWLSRLSGDLVLISICAIIYTRKKPEAILLMILPLLIAWYICLPFKFEFFKNWDKPAKVFSGSQLIHIPGNYSDIHYTFPSGGALNIASVFTMIAWINRHSKVGCLLLSLLSILLSYSLIYTGESFPGDILAASLLGTIVSLICIRFYEGRIIRWFARKSSWTQGVIIAIIRTAAIMIILVNIQKFGLLNKL